MNGKKTSPDIKTYEYYVKVTRNSLMAMTLAALILLIVTLPISFYRKDSVLIVIHLIFLTFIFLNILFIKKYGNLLLAVLTIIIPAYIVLLYSLFIGTSDTISWFYIFPILSFFFLGKRLAFIVNIIFLVSLLVSLYYRFSILPEGYISIAITGLTYTTITILSYLFEANREEIQAKLIESSMIDFLTGCLNRRCLDRDINLEIESSARYQNKFSLILLDVDQFKQINDNYGHVVGDIVLRELTEKISASLRFNDSLYRLGGDEFIILLPNTDLGGARQMCERIIDFIAKAEFSFVKKLTLSAGVIQGMPNLDIESLLAQADRMLYLAKKNGKNRLEYRENQDENNI